MPTQHNGFGQTLTRASVLPVFVFLVVIAYLVPSSILATPVVEERRPTSGVWKAAYSEMYPGCISTVLWPSAEEPVALVVVGADGSTARVSREEARTRAATGDLPRTIGACRSFR
jgi:hypothetical protein